MILKPYICLEEWVTYTPRTIALNYFINVSYATFKTVYMDSRRSPRQGSILNNYFSHNIWLNVELYSCTFLGFELIWLQRIFSYFLMQFF